MLHGSLAVVVLALLGASHACDMMGATGCPKLPESALRTEDFLSFCEQFRAHLACVFDSYKGCERKDKYAQAMPSLQRGLNNKIRKMEKVCETSFGIPIPELNEDGSERVTAKAHSATKKRKRIPTTTSTTTSTSTTTTSTTTQEPCDIDLIPSECHAILPNVQYMSSWPGMVRKRWCNSATPYFNCLKARMYHCEGNARYADSFAYYAKVRAYVETESNKHCPGGIQGCIVNAADERCRAGPKFGNMVGSTATARTTFSAPFTAAALTSLLLISKLW